MHEDIINKGLQGNLVIWLRNEKKSLAPFCYQSKAGNGFDSYKLRRLEFLCMFVHSG